MALEYRRRGRKNLGQEGQSRLDDSPRGGGRPRPSQGIVDSSPSSTYFNITDIPSYKSLLMTYDFIKIWINNLGGYFAK